MRRQAVDISPLRRVNQAIWLLTTGAARAVLRGACAFLCGVSLYSLEWVGTVSACTLVCCGHPPNPHCYNAPLRRFVVSATQITNAGAREAAFRNVKTMSECLADELMNAAKGSSNRCGWRACAWLCRDGRARGTVAAGAACRRQQPRGSTPGPCLAL